MDRSAARGLLLATTSLVFTTPAFGQTAKAPPAPQAGAPDIIVTAQRRDESLSRTPVSVAVISADTLAKAQIVSQQDLRVATPGLSVRASFNSNQLNYAMRGASQDAQSGTRPGVLPYINEVQVAGGGGATAFYDLQSVQVLKGPQGTLFGRSATGGAVLFTTARPTDHLSGYASLLGGNYGAFKGEGAIGGPIVGDTVEARIAGFYSRGDGFQHNLYDGKRPGDYQRFGIRGSVTAHLGDRVTNDLMVDYYHARGGSTINVISGILPLGAPGTPPYFPSQLLYAGVATPEARATGIATLSAVSGVDSATAASVYDAYFADPHHPRNGLLGYLADQQARGPYTVDSDASSTYRAKNIVITNTTSLDLSDKTKLKNIFGYTHLNTFTGYDLDSTPYDIGSDGEKGAGHCFCFVNRGISDEVQLVGDTLGDRLSYVTGFYFSDERSPNDYYSEFFDLAVAPYGLQGQVVRNAFIISNRTYAGYAQGTYKLTDSGLSATAGLRYTSERVRKQTLPDDTVRAAVGTPAPPGYNWDKATTYNKLSWTFGLQDQISPDLLLYAASRRAYKSGGYNGSVSLDGPALIGGDAYKAEQVTDAEVGAKFKGRIGDMPARLNVAFYYDWLRDSQRTAFTVVGGAPSAITVNVPRGRIYGAEMDGVIQPARWLSIGGTANLTRPRFTDGNVLANGIAQLFDRVPDTPRFSGTLFADVTVPLGGDLSLLLHGDAYRQAKSYTNARSFNYAGTTIPAYTLIGLRAGLENEKQGWSLTANVKNVTDKVYYVGGIATGEVYQINSLTPGDPRTFTVELRYKF